MCASYHTTLESHLIFKNLSLKIDEIFRGSRYVVPRTPAPVIVKQDGRIQVKEMSFSLVPSWSKDSKIKFATHNARLDTITDKPTWKIPFQRSHCLVPIKDFVEPIYENQFAGNMVKFSEVNDRLLFAAGIHDTWVDRTTGEALESFAIVTHNPPSFIFDIGHDRCPIFLNPDSQMDWLNLVNVVPSELKEFLLSNAAQINFKVNLDRPMKTGWEKRK